MKDNKKSQQNNKTTKTASRAISRVKDQTGNCYECRMTHSGLDRDILINTALSVSLLVNLFFLVGFIVIGNDPVAAHSLGAAIYGL